MSDKKNFWYGFDFDGTLSKGREGKEATPLIYTIKEVIDKGFKCKIFTARTGLKNKNAVRKFLKAHNLPQLEITNKKDKYLIAIVDNRAIGVVRDEGKTHYSVVGEIMRAINVAIDNHRNVKGFRSAEFDRALELCDKIRTSFARECAKYGSGEYKK